MCYDGFMSAVCVFWSCVLCLKGVVCACVFCSCFVLCAMFVCYMCVPFICTFFFLCALLVCIYVCFVSFTLIFFFDGRCLCLCVGLFMCCF